MNVELFTFCDSVNEYNGKMVIAGTFDSVLTRSVPTIQPILGISAKVRFSNKEIGKYPIKIILQNEKNDKAQEILSGEIEVKQSPTQTSIVNIAINLCNFPFETYGEYTCELHIGDKLAAAIPLYLIKVN